MRAICQRRRAEVVFVLAAAVMLGFGSSGCATSRCREWAGQIRNDHIVWAANSMGLRVYAVGAPELKLLQSGPSCRRYVVEALADESRYVAAHVILTQMEPGYSFSPTEWNHLRVIVHPDGRTEIPDEQRAEIQKLWTQTHW
jgi:hypothetical protein